MRCKQAEKLLSKSFDDRLNGDDLRILDAHLTSCPACRTAAEEYRGMLALLRDDPSPEPPPYFWQRLQPRMAEPPDAGTLPLWKHWGLRAIPLSLLLIVTMAAAALLFLPAQPEELSRSGILLRDEIPIEDGLPLLQAENLENPNMALIFAATEIETQTRRFP